MPKEKMNLKHNYEIGSTSTSVFTFPFYITTDDLLKITTSETDDEDTPEIFEIAFSLHDSTQKGIDTRIWVKPNNKISGTIKELAGTDYYGVVSDIAGTAKEVNTVVAVIYCSYKINIDITLSKT